VACLFGVRVVVSADDQAVYHDLDGVNAVAIQFDVFFQIADFAINANAGESGFLDVLKHFFVMPFASTNDGRKDLNTYPAVGVGGKLIGERLHFVHDLLCALGDDFFATDRTVWDADASVEQTQVVVNLRDGADG